MSVKLFLLSALALPGCFTEQNKCCTVRSVTQIDKNLYVEHYNTLCPGVFGERTSCYLTDSSSFRQEIGSYGPHDRFAAWKDGDSIRTAYYELRSYSDTVGRKKISNATLFTTQQPESAILSSTPLFGTNKVTCDKYSVFSTYKIPGGGYFREVQFRCDRDYQNAIYYLDTSKFSVLVGFYPPDNLTKQYTVQRNKNGVEFFDVDIKRNADTVSRQVFSFSALKKKKFAKPCK